MENKLLLWAYVIFQFVVLFAVVGMMAWVFYETKEVEQTFAGALIGMLVGINIGNTIQKLKQEK